MEPTQVANASSTDLKDDDMKDSRGILMVAFHYPPIASSSGHLRTVYFSRYLRQTSWNPIVLTVHPRAYLETNAANIALTGDVEVCRSFALDAARHLSWRKKYPLFFALPDRWVSWTVAAVFSGLRLIMRRNIKVIWSTFPIPTALLIGFLLKKLTRRPWVVDIRDVIVDDDYPELRQQRVTYAWLERRVADTADAVVVTTPGAMEIYRGRYPDIGDRLHWIANGFDEEVFQDVEELLQPSSKGDRITLVHAGLLSQADRNPSLFFDAISRLKQCGEIDESNLRVVLRATGEDDIYLAQIEKKNISDIVHLCDAVKYTEALTEMFDSDGLLLFQGSTCNHAVPAKIYEYFRCRKPILAIADPIGDTVELLQTVGTGIIADCNSSEAIEKALKAFIELIEMKTFSPLDEVVMQQFSRKAQAEKLVAILDDIEKRK